MTVARQTEFCSVVSLPNEYRLNSGACSCPRLKGVLPLMTGQIYPQPLPTWLYHKESAPGKPQPNAVCWALIV